MTYLGTSTVEPQSIVCVPLIAPPVSLCPVHIHNHSGIACDLVDTPVLIAFCAPPPPPPPPLCLPDAHHQAEKQVLKRSPKQPKAAYVVSMADQEVETIQALPFVDLV